MNPTNSTNSTSELSTMPNTIASSTSRHLAIVTRSSSISSSSSSSTPPSISPSPAVTLHKFPKLATEIRKMIWLLAAAEPRTIVIIHDYIEGPEDGKLTSRAKNIKERYPGLLGACFESRNLVINFYNTVFPTPKLGRERYHYTGKDDPKYVRELARSLIPDFDSIPHHDYLSTDKIEKMICNHLNKSRPIVPPDYATRLRRETTPLMPAFFNPNMDIILMRRRKGHYSSTFHFQGIFSFGKTHHASAVRNLAVELDSLTRRAVSRFNTSHKSWTDVHDYIALTSLESLYLVCLEDKEVIKLSVDASKEDSPDRLVEKQWIFGLETDNKLFREAMGENWSGVLWKVEVAKTAGKTLWQLAARWKAGIDKWETDKRRICEGNVRVPTKWWNATRAQGMSINRKLAATVKYTKRVNEEWYEGTVPIGTIAVGQ